MREFVVLLALLGGLAGCGGGDELVRLRIVLEDPSHSCQRDILRQIDALRPELRTPQGTQDSCQAAGDPELDSLSQLQQLLSGSVQFGELDGGHYAFKLVGFDDHCPSPNEPLLCGFLEFDLPARAASLTMEVSCHQSGSTPPAFHSCRTQ